MRNALIHVTATLVLTASIGCERPQRASDQARAELAPDGAPPAEASAVAPPPGANNPVPQVRTQAPGFYRMMLGDFEITAVSDGTTLRPVDKLLTHVRPGEVQELLARNYENALLELSINAYLINTGSKLILVDTGAGDLFGPKEGGRLSANLRAAGYPPEQIEAVLLTHVHGDHSGGLVVSDKMVFPNARVYLSKLDRDFWLSPAEAEKARADEKRRFADAHRALDPYVAAGKISAFDAPGELFPGITTIPAPGHTPGSTFYSVQSKGQKLLLWGDVIHVAEVQFPDPAVTIQFDHDADEAARQRAKIFADAAKQGYWVASDHISFPGLGHVRAEGASYVWIPAPYSLQL